MIGLLLTPLASAVDVKVRHLGYLEVYRVQPGEQVVDTWYAVPPTGAVGRIARRAPRPDVTVRVAVVDAAADQLQVRVRVEQTIDGARAYLAEPTLVVDADVPRGHMYLGRDLPLVDPDATEGPNLRFRYLKRPELEVTVRPEGEVDVAAVGPSAPAETLRRAEGFAAVVEAALAACASDVDLVQVDCRAQPCVAAFSHGRNDAAGRIARCAPWTEAFGDVVEFEAGNASCRDRTLRPYLLMAPEQAGSHAARTRVHQAAETYPCSRRLAQP